MDSARKLPPSEPPAGGLRSSELRELGKRIEDILAGRRAGRNAASEAVSTAWPGVDALLPAGGLARGSTHEWIGVVSSGRQSEREPWSPPLALAAHLAGQVLEQAAERGKEGAVLWIGPRVCPYPRTLVRDFTVREGACRKESGTSEVELARQVSGDRVSGDQRSGDQRSDLLLARSILIDVSDPASRLWTIDTALRCGSVLAVVADASELDMVASRRLQLAAEAGDGLGLLLRPPSEEGWISAAATRWRVRRTPPRAGLARPSWTLDLLRCKG